MSGKRYPEEFKIEAVKQVTDRGYKVGEVAKRLGITTKSLHDWIKRYGDLGSQHQDIFDHHLGILIRDKHPRTHLVDGMANAQGQITDAAELIAAGQQQQTADQRGRLDQGMGCVHLKTFSS